jgi:hypothetical protein
MAKGGAKKAAKKAAGSSARKQAPAKHPELGKGARFLVSAAAGHAVGTIVAHDGREATIEHADGSSTRRAVGAYELVQHGRRYRGH